MPLFLVEDSVRKIYILAKDWQTAFTAWSDKVEDDFDCAPIDEQTLETEPIKKVSMQLLADDREVLIQREIQAEIPNDLASKARQWDKVIEERAAKYTPLESQQREGQPTQEDGKDETLEQTLALTKDHVYYCSCVRCVYLSSNPQLFETRDSQTNMRNDPPTNSPIKCPNCDSMSYYTDGHHELICSVCQYIAPRL